MGTTWRIRLVHRNRNGTLQMPYVIHHKDKIIDNIRHSLVFPKTIQHATDVLQGWNFSCRTGFNLRTSESSTSNPTIQTRKWKKVGIEDPIRNIYKSKPPSSTSEGASQGSIPRETPTGDPRKNPNGNCIPIKDIYQLRTFEGAYCGEIHRGTPTSEPSKKRLKISTKQKFGSYTKKK